MLVAQPSKAPAERLAVDLPTDFLLGVSTSSYQIEGAASEAGRSPSIWDTFCATPGKIVDGSDGAVACDHYHLWPQDLDLITALGFRAYRFSIAWPRVIPAGTGKANEAGLDFYERLVDGMLERGLEPHATLYHWDLPQVLEDRGGWTDRDTALAFADYADVVSARLGDRVRTYATLNEPWCSAFLGYAYGEHAPGRRDWQACQLAIHHLLLAHGLAVPRLRANTSSPVGIVLNFTPGYPAGAGDQEACRRYDALNHRVFLDPLFAGSYPAPLLDNGISFPVRDGDLAAIAAPLDFLGVNFYTRALIADDPGAPWPSVRTLPATGSEHTAMGWEVYPDALEALLVRLSALTGLPLYVTENGAAYDDLIVDAANAGAGDQEVPDPQRLDYFRTHLAALTRAVSAGADVRGYFAWSLLDNFEWAYGYTKRFGIVHVDLATQVRTPKHSALWLAQLNRELTRE